MVNNPSEEKILTILKETFLLNSAIGKYYFSQTLKIFNAVGKPPYNSQKSFGLVNWLKSNSSNLKFNKIHPRSQSEIIRGLSIIMLGLRGIFLELSVVMVVLFSTT